MRAFEYNRGLVMRNVFLLSVLALAISKSFAAGYVGGVFLYNRHAIGCADFNVCSDKYGGYQFLAGARVDARYALIQDDIAVDTVEFGVSKFGRAEATRTVLGYYYDSKGKLQSRQVGASTSVSSNALHGAIIGRWSPAADFEMFGKVGLAYVSSTASDALQGGAMGSRTENHFSPYLGLGLEYMVYDGFGVSVDASVMRFKIDGQRGRLQSLGLGLRYHY
jgi:OmpA-like transmembrane domain